MGAGRHCLSVQDSADGGWGWPEKAQALAQLCRAAQRAAVSRGGKCGQPQRRRVAGEEGGATLRQELGRWAQRWGVPQCPRGREVAGLARRHQPERKDLPLAAVAGGRHCPLSLAAGSRTPARQLLGECSKEP